MLRKRIKYLLIVYFKISYEHKEAHFGNNTRFICDGFSF